MADTAALLGKFVAALHDRSRAASNEAAFALLAFNAPLRDKWRMLAMVLRTNGELAAANHAMRLLVEQTGHTAVGRYEQAALAAQTGRVEQAWAIMQGVPPDVPDKAGHAYFLGTMALNMGETERAERHLLAALDSNPQLGSAMLALASIGRRSADDPVARRILDAGPAMVRAPPLERAQHHYAAGRLLFDRGAVDAAFDRFGGGAALAARERPYDASADRADAERSRAGYDRGLIDRVAGTVTVDSSEAIVVTGLPRSGSTLVEQILASHSAVAGGEELGAMAIVERDLPAKSAAGLEAYLASRPADDLTRLYLHLGRQRFGAEGRYVDKGLNNTRHIGTIAALLPQTPIVWLRRDPLDCALSAFRTYFVRGLDWSWKLEDIAAHFRIEDELFAFWAALLPDRILVVDYPELVADPRGQIERIFEHCGLPAEPQVFAPHETKRTVSTASAVQVREPINRRGLGSAAPYREHMKPFLEAYAA